MARMTLDDLVAQLRQLYGEQLHAVVLYGSAAAGEHIEKHSDLNVLVIVSELNMDHLTREAAIARAWAEGDNPPPLTMSREEWLRCSDIYAMEYADILERHRVLHGDLPTEGVAVDRRHLRLQLEYEAMGKLLRLRQGILAAGGYGAAHVDLLDASMSTYMVLFRALLRLHGEEPPRDYAALTERAAALAGFDAAPFLRVVRHVRGAERLPRTEVMSVLSGYLDGAQRLVSHIDRLELS